MSLDLISPGPDVPDAIHAIIEIPMDADPIKYEVDKPSGAIFVDRIQHFFEHYKDLENGKWVRFEGWRDAADAREEVPACIERYRAQKQEASG